MDKLGGVMELDKMTACSKIAYYLICEHIGTVDGSARGKLFDVKSDVNARGKLFDVKAKSAGIDAADKKNDNVLFSVSDTEAGWHTDGASKDTVYDVVGLLCISPAAKGGKFKFSNGRSLCLLLFSRYVFILCSHNSFAACNVYDEIAKAMPKFMMHELTRMLPRDVLENGNGKGLTDIDSSLSRSEDILAMRIRYNSYPIYATEGDRMRFRYMRYWIETGHTKTGWRVPTLLRIAMDILDDELDKACVFHERLDRGDIIFANNAMLAHARDAFENIPGEPPRHKVRAWLQIQKVGAFNSDSEEVEQSLKKSLGETL